METIKAIFGKFLGGRKMTLGIVGTAVIITQFLLVLTNKPELVDRALLIGGILAGFIGYVSRSIAWEDIEKARMGLPKSLPESLGMIGEGFIEAKPTTEQKTQWLPNNPGTNSAVTMPFNMKNLYPDDMGSSTLDGKGNPTSLDPVVEGAQG